MRDAADKLHHVQTALQLAHGVAQQLAVFGGHQVDEFLFVLFDQYLELENHPCALLGVERGPCGLRRLGGSDSLLIDRTVIEERHYVKGWQNVEITFEELIHSIQRGHAYCSQVDGYRDADHFLASDVASVDVDKGLAIEDALRIHWFGTLGPFCIRPCAIEPRLPAFESFSSYSGPSQIAAKWRPFPGHFV
jgi:hypothetical protein